MINPNLEFVNIEFLWLLLLLPLIVVWYVFKNNKQSPAISISSISSFSEKSFWARLRPILYVLKILALASLIVAFARPRSVSVSTKTKSSRGLDIIMAVDVSASMFAKDLKPDRLTALKKVATKFVEDRKNDRIGVVVYAGESYTQTPITSDKNIIKRAIADIKYGLIEDGTAIGMGLGSAVNKLKNSTSASKVVILLTDGVNNTGFVDPRTAAGIAADLEIKVYTIGIGTNGLAPFPVGMDAFGRFVFENRQTEIDEELLRHIAGVTGGKYFRATDNKKLELIYEEIDKLEKTEIEELRFYNYTEYFRYFVLVGLGFLLLEFFIRNLFFKNIV